MTFFRRLSDQSSFSQEVLERLFAQGQNLQGGEAEVSNSSIFYNKNDKRTRNDNIFYIDQDVTHG